MSIRRLSILMVLGLTLVAAVRAGDEKKVDEKLPRKDAYRYDGKTFAEWRVAVLTELKVEKRIEALKALKAFGKRGFEKETAAVVMQVVEDHLREYDEYGRGDKVLGAARDALQSMPATSEPLVLARLKGPKSNVQTFSLEFLAGTPRVFRCITPSAGGIAQLMDMVQGDDTDVAASGLAVLYANVLEWDGKSQATSQATFADQMKNEARAKAFIAALARDVEKNPKAVAILTHLGPTARSASPALVKALGNEKANRSLVLEALEQVGCDVDQVMPHLIRMIEKKQEIDAVLAYVKTLGAKGKPATLALVKLLRSREYQIEPILSALEEIKADPQQTVPAAIEVINQSGYADGSYISPAFKLGIGHIKRLGPRADVAVPGLIELLTRGWKVRTGERGQPVIQNHALGSEGKIQCVEALAQIGPAARAALPTLAEFGKQNSELGRAALRAIAKIEKRGK